MESLSFECDYHGTMEKDKIKVLLITPTALDGRGEPVKQKKLLLPSITMPMLAAVTPDSVKVKLIYETVEDIPYDEHWDLVGLTGMGSGSVRAWQIADMFRRKGSKVVIGGVGPSLFTPESTLEHADTLVIGEAEETWPKLLKDFIAGSMKNIYQATQPPKMETLPTPRYDLMNFRKIGFIRSVQATRGCPFQCKFCSVTAFSKGLYRKRPASKVIQDVQAAKKTGSRYIVFLDDNLFFDPEYNRELWEALIPEKIIWISSCSLHVAQHPDLLKLAHRSGCRLLSIGFESLESQNLEEISKGWNRPDRYTSAINMIRQCGIMVSISIIIGFDGDTGHTFQTVYDFIMENHIPIPRVLILTPIPGTPLHDMFEAENRIICRDYGKYTGGCAVFKPKNMTPEDLQNGYWRLYEQLFTRANILRRMSYNVRGMNPIIVAGLMSANFHYRHHIKSGIVPGIT